MVHHWQAIYRHAFHRGGPLLTSALSGIDQALWDIKGKALGVPVYELLGGPTRDKVRVYASSNAAHVRALMAKGFTTFKTSPAKKRPTRYIETPRRRQGHRHRHRFPAEPRRDGENRALDTYPHRHR